MSAQGRPKRELAPERDSAEGSPVSPQGRSKGELPRTPVPMAVIVGGLVQ
jgi:hypothetical protein